MWTGLAQPVLPQYTRRHVNIVEIWVNKTKVKEVERRPVNGYMKGMQTQFVVFCYNFTFLEFVMR